MLVRQNIAECGRGDDVGFRRSAKSVSRNIRAVSVVGNYFSSIYCISARKAVILRRSKLLLGRETHSLSSEIVDYQTIDYSKTNRHEQRHHYPQGVFRR